MDALIFFGWLLVGTLAFRLRAQLGAPAWLEWQQASEPDQDDDVFLGLHALGLVAAYGDATDDASEAARVHDLARFSGNTLGQDLATRLRGWHRQARLLALADDVAPLPAHDFADPWLRALTRLDAGLRHVPGRASALARLRRRFALLRVAARLADWRRGRSADATARRDTDEAALEQAVLAAHATLERALHARREQLHGRRH